MKGINSLKRKAFRFAMRNDRKAKSKGANFLTIQLGENIPPQGRAVAITMTIREAKSLKRFLNNNL